MVKKSFAGLVLGLTLFLCNCSAPLSNRDSQKEQARSSAEIKRRELEQVASDYRGTLNLEEGDRKVFLKLEIKEIPTTVEGSVDPVPTPILTGFLKFFYNDNTAVNEFAGFSVQKADYDPTSLKLNLVVDNPDYKQLLFSLRKDGNNLVGSWIAPVWSARGNTILKRLTSEDTP